MSMFIYEREGWPEFRWSNMALSPTHASVRHRQGGLIGRMETLGFPLQSDALLQTLTERVLKSNEIEGETPDKDAAGGRSTSYSLVVA